MSGDQKAVSVVGVLYTSTGVYPPGCAVPLPADHAADLAASGHVTVEPPANLPEVSEKEVLQDPPKPPKNSDNARGGKPALD